MVSSVAGANKLKKKTKRHNFRTHLTELNQQEEKEEDIERVRMLEDNQVNFDFEQ